MKNIANEISKGKNLQVNLGKFAQEMMSMYNNYSYVRLAMNYFTYYEMVVEASNKDKNLNDLMKSFNKIVNNGIISGSKETQWEKMIDETNIIRNKVINVMKGLTSYVDIFNIFEYCLNRVEYNYKDGSSFFDETDEEITKSLMSYILSEKDNVVVNSKIVEIVRQLPIRMTKNKFFELLKEGIKVYRGSEISSVENFLYMIKTSSMIEISPYINDLSEDVKSIYEEFSAINFSELDENKYNDLRQKLSFAVSYLEQSISLYMSLGELINDLYVILLSSSYNMNTSKDSNVCKSIINKINNMFEEDELTSIYDKVADDFIELEGRQEMLQAKFSSCEFIIDLAITEQSESLQKLMLQKTYNSLKQIMDLESGSIFVEFSETNSNIADDSYIEKVTNELVQTLTSLFKNNPKLLNRAIMAHVLSGLPVFFNNIEEINNYISNSLSQCRDIAEKSAVIEILKQMIEEEI